VYLWKADSGFSLLETIVSVTLVGFLVTGLFITWNFSESKERGLNSYWMVKEDLETAYEITHRSLRSMAASDISITTATNSAEISFIDINKKSWRFYAVGSSYKMDYESTTQTLIDSGLKSVQFTDLGENKVRIRIEVDTPSNWNSARTNDLIIDGVVYLRNLE
jgi:hypothetical protein